MRRFLFLLILATPAQAADLPAVPLYKTFGRWIVACDNVRRCEARGFDEYTRADLRIIRDAGPATPTVTFSWDELPAPATLRLDGQPLALPTPPWTANKADETLATSDPAAIATFIATIRNGQRITTAANPAAGIPLQGLVAALLLVDAVQGRPGTPTALVAPRGNNGVPGAPGLPGKPAWHPATALTTAETAAVIEKAQRSEAFRDQNKDAVCTSQGVPLPPPEAFALQPDRALVLEQCGLAPYNQGIIAIITPRDDKAPEPFKASLPLLGREEGTVNGSLFNGGFDPKTGTLSTAYRGRALSDCGYSARWIWSNGAFQLSEFAMLGPCGGAKLGDWPILYRTAH
jgi:hypothetical protein